MSEFLYWVRLKLLIDTSYYCPLKTTLFFRLFDLDKNSLINSTEINIVLTAFVENDQDSLHVILFNLMESNKDATLTQSEFFETYDLLEDFKENFNMTGFSPQQLKSVIFLLLDTDNNKILNKQELDCLYTCDTSRFKNWFINWKNVKLWWNRFQKKYGSENQLMALMFTLVFQNLHSFMVYCVFL